jgi:RNA polymerase sigma-70 factor (ECF subfamily)
VSSGKLTDKILFIRLKERDREAFIKAYDLYLENIYRFIFFKVSSREEAEDLTSAVFLKTWDHIQNNRISDYATLKALLYKVARNTVIDHYRKKSQEQNTSLDADPIAETLPDERQDVRRQHEIAGDFETLQKCMIELKDEYREVITLRFLNEMDIGEIADVLDKSKGNVRVLLFRAMNALREIADNYDKK